jgi:hypothetical protein
VTRLYSEAFSAQLSKAAQLGYGHLQWGDAEAIQIGRVMTTGAMSSCEGLWLNDNAIGDQGLVGLIGGLSDPASALTRLAELRLNSNSIGDEGMASLAKAFASMPPSTLPRLKTLLLFGNPASAETQKAAKGALKAHNQRCARAQQA